MQLYCSAQTNDDIFNFYFDENTDRTSMDESLETNADNQDFSTIHEDTDQMITENNKEIIGFLFDALKNKNYPLMINLLKKSHINLHEFYKDNSLLNIAVIKNDEIAADILLRYKADPNFGSIRGITPLMLAVYENKPVFIDKLLRYGADPYITNASGHNTFDCIRDNNIELYNKLLSFDRKISPQSIQYNLSNNDLNSSSNVKETK